MKILLVEDDQSMAVLIKRKLEQSIKGVEVTHVTSPREVFANMRDAEVLVIDLKLPDFNGAELVSILKDFPMVNTQLCILTSTPEEALDKLGNINVPVFSKGDLNRFVEWVKGFK